MSRASERMSHLIGSSLALISLCGFADEKVPAAGYDASFLSAPPVKPSPSPLAKPQSTARRLRDTAPKEGRLEDQKLAETVASLSLLIETLPAGGERNRLILNRSIASARLGRKKVLESKSFDPDQEAARFLDSAVKDAQFVITSKDSPQALQSQARRALGIAYVYQNRNELARPLFVQVLSEDPRVENGPWLALVVAEDLFDAKSFSQALEYYRHAERATIRESSEFARYKQAWCYVNLNDLVKAEQMFSALVSTGSEKSGVARDSMRDLALLVSQGPDPERSLRLARSLFKKPDDESRFLGYVRAGVESRKLAAAHAKIVARMMELAPAPDKKLELLIAVQRMHRAPVASREHHAAFEAVRDFMKSTTVAPGSGLEFEMRGLLETFIECFSGRVKSPDFPNPAETGVFLEQQIDFFNEHFPDARNRERLVQIWLDLCADLRSHACVERAVGAVLKDPAKLGALTDTALWYRITSLEHLESQNPSESTRLALIDALAQTLKQRPQHREWLRIAKRYADLLLKGKKLKEAVPVLKEIHDRDHAPESFYNLQLARLQAGDPDAVLNEPVVAAAEKAQPGLSEIRREAALGLAGRAKDRGDVVGYRENIQLFLSLRPAPDKARIARIDYLQFLAHHSHMEELTKELLSLTPEERFDKDLSDKSARAWLWNMASGRYSAAAKLVSASAPGARQTSEALYFETLAGIANDQIPPSQALALLPTEKRNYVLGLLALLRPASVISYFDAAASSSPGKHPLRPGSDRELALLAFRIESGDWGMPSSPAATRVLGQSVEKPSPLEAGIARLRADCATPPGARKFVSVVGRVVSDVRRLRGRVAGEIGGKAAEIQLRILSQMTGLERDTAALIRRSPMPKGLSQSDAEAYRAQLEEAAKEFDGQATEFDKVFRATLGKQQAALEAAQARVPNRLLRMDDWPWPAAYGSDGFAAVREAVKSGKFLAAMIVTDLLRPTHLKADEDYFWIRTGIFLSSTNSAALRRYLVDELQHAMQAQIVKKWAELAKEEK